MRSENVMTSQLKTVFLLALLTGLLLFIGQAAGGRAGLIIALILALVMNVTSYWYSDKIVLSMHSITTMHNNFFILIPPAYINTLEFNKFFVACNTTY